MSFKLNVVRTPKNDSNTGGGDRREIDYEALNVHVCNAARAPEKKPRSIPGYVSGIIDLGVQKPEDYDGPVKVGDAYPKNAEYYTAQDGTKHVRFTRKPVQQVAITVDFPQIMVDYGLYFNGESNPVPLRFLLNGEWTVKGDGGSERVVGRGYNLSETRFDDGTWALAKNNRLHQIAAATGCLDDNGYFKAQNVGDLLGKVAQWEISLFLKENNGRNYLNERIKLAGVVPEGVAVPALDDKFIYGINFSGENDPEAVKQLRRAVKNTIRKATNYEGSDLQRQMDGGGASTPPPASAPPPAAASKPSAPLTNGLVANRSKYKPEPKESAVEFEDDSELPF